MEYSKLKDVTALLDELCEFDDADVVLLMNVKQVISRNDKFADAYIHSVSSAYFNALQNQNYKRPPFRVFHNKLINHLKTKKELTDIPSFDTANNATNLLLRIRQIEHHS